MKSKNRTDQDKNKNIIDEAYEQHFYDFKKTEAGSGNRMEKEDDPYDQGNNKVENSQI